MELETFAYDGVRMNVRRGVYHNFDTGIVREVAHEYWWGRLPQNVEYAVDVGAHIGAWAKRLLLYRPTAKIAAVEVDSENVFMLRVNSFGEDHIQAFHAAMTYSTDEKLHLVRTADGNSGGHRVEVSDAGDSIGVRVTLEELIEAAGFPHVDVLKLDCEGSEFDILKNAKRGTLRNIQMIVGEHHSTRDEFHKQIGVSLEKAGFTLEYKGRVAEMGMFLAVRS